MRLFYGHYNLLAIPGHDVFFTLGLQPSINAVPAMSDDHPPVPGQPLPSDRRTVLVAGDGVAGLATGLALDAVGHDASVYGYPARGVQRGPLDAFVADAQLQGYLHAHDLGTNDALTTTASEYRYLSPDGSIEAAFGVDLHFSATDTLSNRLQSALPDDVIARDTQIQEPSRDHRDPPGHDTGAPARLTLEDGRTVEGDLLVGADGWLSPTRRAHYPDVRPDYAGYVSWQGTLPESAIPHDLTARFADALTVSRGNRDLLAAMVLPGPHGGTAAGDRRVHWVWYTPVPDRDLGTALTDRTGRSHDTAVPPGMLQDRFVTALHDDVAEHAPAFARLVRATPDPGMTPVVDLTVPSAVVERTVLVGDAAFATRQHTGAVTPKAFSDAAALATALDRYENLDDALADWRDSQDAIGRRLVEQGRRTDLDRLVRRP